jgi:hypothetical protein
MLKVLIIYLYLTQLDSFSYKANRSLQPESSLPCSQEPATCPYPYPDARVHNILPHFFIVLLTLLSNSRLGLGVVNGLFVRFVESFYCKVQYIGERFIKSVFQLRKKGIKRVV